MKKITVFAAIPMLLAMLVVSGQVFADNGNTASASLSVNTGFLQLNNLSVQSVSGSGNSGEIDAVSQVFNPVPLDANAGAPAIQQNCRKFNSESDSASTPVACPTPVNTGAAVSGSATMGLAPYRIEVSATTQLMLRDRTQASLSDFSQGDQINVFGYYNADGSVQAYLVRDLSKPVQTETLQLNNVMLVSVSNSSTPATLTVTQQTGFPCYGFDTKGSATSIACPMGTASASPSGVMVRKYVVNVDGRTTILDRNRTQLSLANLNAGDQLNIYGETSDNGQTITADIVRDTSVPAAPSTYSGTVTQVNSDGSFVIQTSAGQLLTVQSPVSVGESVNLQGMLNAAQNTISQISRLVAGTNVMTGSTIQVPPPIPMPMMRINGGTYPTSTHGKPINY